MSNELKRVGLVFTQEGAVDFKKTLQEVSLALNNNYNQFKLTQAQWDSSTKSTEKLRTEQEYLKNAYEIQADKVSTLKMQLSDLENTENKNTTAIKKKRNELTNAEIKLETYNKRLKEIENQLTNTGKNIEEFGTKIEKAGEKIEKAGKKLSAFSAATGTALLASAKSAIDFEEAFTGVEKTVDGTVEQIEELKQGIRNMAKEIPSSTTEISAVAEAAGQLGIQTENVLEFTKTMIDMGNATNLSADEAATTLARFANVTRMKQSDFNKLGSVIVELGNNFATTESEIAQMGMNLASAGTQVGMSQSQIMALATALSSVGLEAQAGGTAFSKVMVNMQLAVEKGGDSLKDFAGVAGMSSKDFQKAFKQDATGAIMKFVEGLSKSDERGKSAIKVLDDMEIKETRLRDALLRSANASDIFSDAIKLGSEAWEDNTALTNEANKRYGTLKSQITIIMNKIKDLAIIIGNKLMPHISNLIKGIENTTKWFTNLSDEQVNTIVKIGALVTTIGPLLTITGKLTSTIGNGIKALGTFTQAIGVMKGTVSTTSIAVNGLASVMSAIASPIGIATIAITAITGAMIYFTTKQTDAQREAKNLAKEMENQKKTLEEYNKSIDDTTNANLSQIDSVSKLKNELATLADENGKVKEGYEGRVSFILNELNATLGTEYKLNGDIIQSYQSLRNEIDKTIEKKKAEIKLSAEEEKYKDAIKNQTEAVKQLKEIQEKLGMSYDEVREKYGKYIDKINNNTFTLKDAEEIGSTTEYKKIQELANLSKAYDDAEWKVKDYTQKIKIYEEDYAKFAEGKYNEIGKTITETTKNMTNTATDNLKEAIQIQQKDLQDYSETVKNTNNTIAQEYATQSQENLDKLIDELYKRTSTVETLGKSETEAWKQVASQSYEKYSAKMKEIPEETRKKIEEATGIVSSNVDLAIKSGELANKVTVNFNNNADGEKAGKNFTQGVKIGLANQNEVSGAVKASGSLGSKILNKFKDILGIHSPSKEAEEAAEYFIEGFITGINGNQKDALKSIESLANGVNDEFDGNLENRNNYKLNVGHNSSNIDYNKMANAMLSALTGCKFTLDEDGFAKIVKDELYKVV